MQRELKFRVWNKTTKHFCDIPFLACHGGQLLWLHTGNNITISNLDDNEHIVQQFTGLKDKNNKEIYEGDFIKLVDKNSLEYKENYILKVEWNYNSYDCFYFDVAESFEVIGNIFENPDLLKK